MTNTTLAGAIAMMIVLAADDIAEVLNGGVKTVAFLQSDGDVFNGVSPSRGPGHVPGTVFSGSYTPTPVDTPFHVQVEVRRLADVPPISGAPRSVIVDGTPCLITGRVWDHGEWAAGTVQVVSVRDDLPSRRRGLLETCVLAAKRVLIVALGSVGSTVARQIAQLGVGRVTLIDPDRVEVSNVVRHEARLSDVGRLKTNVMAELYLEKNPSAEVVTRPIAISAKTYDLVAAMVPEHDVIIASPDERAAKLLLNKACIAHGKPLIVSGAFRRAYGGHVMCIRPGKTPCYQCFISTLPKASSGGMPEPDRQPIAYSDRPVPIEPGLALDIAPICHMTTKLALQELLRDVPTTLRSLDDDLAACLYQWLNRREAGTPYEHLLPLAQGSDGLRILGWYGIDLPRDPHCPACGDYAGYLAALHGIDITREHEPVGNALAAQREDTHG